METYLSTNKKMIQDTQKIHCFIPITENKIAAKLFSTDTKMSYQNIYKSAKNEE